VLLSHEAVAGRAQPVAALTVYSAPSTGTAKDVAAVRELLMHGSEVVVDSSHPDWLHALPDGVGWVRLHAADGVFAEVVEDAEAAIEATPAVTRLLDALGASSVRVPALPGLVADRLQYTLIGEAVTVVEEGTADAESVDLALELGMNHPRGPFKVLAERGETTVLDGLRAMAEASGDPRYRPAALLVRRAAGLQRRQARGVERGLRLPI
jgi:3-hydroxybutyryl-CoA dehydrogenase